MKLLQTALLLVIAVFSLSATAADYVEGKHYKKLIKPVMVRDPSKIEVVEAFWYGCGHCNHFEPTVNAWEMSIQADVDFRQVPAQFNRQWKIHAELFYLTKALKVHDKVHQGIFDSIHKQRKNLFKKSEQKAFLKQYGVSEADFDKYDDSFVVRRQVKMADQLIRSYGLSGVPAIIVNGKYMVNSSTAGGEEKIFGVVNYLIEQERKLLKK